MKTLPIDSEFYSVFKETGLIKVSGPDAKTFLQGQLSCDLNKISQNTHALGLYCNLKGRMIASFRLFLFKDNYTLSMPIGTISKTLSTLQHYAKFSKVTLEDASNQLIKIGIYIRVSSLDLTPSFPAQLNKAHSEENTMMLRTAHPQGRFECFVKSDALNTIESKLHAIEKSDENRWRLLDIQSEIPNIYASTQEKFLPHPLNFHQLGAIDFEKGCYLGQEIIARMHYRGKSKYHLEQICFESETLPQPGDEIEQGTVVDACFGSDKKVYALVLIIRTRRVSEATVVKQDF